MWKAVRASMAVATLIGLLGPTRVSADPITITSGQVVLTFSGGPFQFNGVGLSVAGSLSAPNDWVGSACFPCPPNRPIPLSFSSSTGTPVAPVAAVHPMLGGTVFPNGALLLLFLQFQGPSFSSSEVSADHLTFSAPFTMTGNLRAELSEFGEVFYATDLIGSGTATMSFRKSAFFVDAQRLTYDFSPGASPTPEPGSLLLLGTGLAGIVTRRARARR
jgi:hypothetical protein